MVQKVPFWDIKCTFRVFSDHLMDFLGPFSGGGPNGIFRTSKCTFWNSRISGSVWGQHYRNTKDITIMVLSGMSGSFLLRHFLQHFLGEQQSWQLFLEHPMKAAGPGGELRCFRVCFSDLCSRVLFSFLPLLLATSLEPKGSKRCFPNGVFQILHRGLLQRKTPSEGQRTLETPAFWRISVPSALADPDPLLNTPLWKAPFRKHCLLLLSWDSFSQHLFLEPFLRPFLPLEKCSFRESEVHSTQLGEGQLQQWTSPQSSGRKFLSEICVQKGQSLPLKTCNGHVLDRVALRIFLSLFSLENSLLFFCKEFLVKEKGFFLYFQGFQWFPWEEKSLSFRWFSLPSSKKKARKGRLGLQERNTEQIGPKMSGVCLCAVALGNFQTNFSRTREGWNCRFQKHPARKVGTRSKQFLPKVPDKFAFPGARNPRICSISWFREAYSSNFPGTCLELSSRTRTDPGNSHSLLEFSENVGQFFGILHDSIFWAVQWFARCNSRFSEEPPAPTLGCTPKGAYGNTAFWEAFWEGSGKGSGEGVLRRVLRRGFSMGFTVKEGSEKGSQKGFWEGGFPEGA